jgi:hypothetical protein
MKHKYRIVMKADHCCLQRRSWCFTWRYFSDEAKFSNVFIRKINCDRIEKFNSLDEAKKYAIIDKIKYDKNEALLNIHSDNNEIKRAAIKKLKESGKPEIIYV